MAGRGCEFPGCPNLHNARGLCRAHQNQLERGQALAPLAPRRPRGAPDTCSVSDCDGKIHGRGVCAKHNRLAYVYFEGDVPYMRDWLLERPVCEACGGTQRLSVDHDHATCHPGGSACKKCIRGRLCGPCNSAGGLLRDSPARMHQLANYYQRTSL